MEEKKHNPKGHGYWALFLLFGISLFILLRDPIRHLPFVGANFNLNEVKFTAKGDLAIGDILVQLEGAEGPVIENGTVTNTVPEQAGINRWQVRYKDLKGTIEHNKSEDWHDHQYTFEFEKIDGEIRCRTIIFGPDNQTTDVILK